MATSTDPARLSVAPFTAPQRQRLEALTAAKMLLKEQHWVGGHQTLVLPPLEALLDVADYIVTGQR